MLVEVWSSAPIDSITDVLAGRMYTHALVQEVAAVLLTDSVALQIAKAQKESEHG